MALTLPNNFKGDIQGRDTNLVPVVVIGELNDRAEDIALWEGAWFISANNLALRYGVTQLPIVDINTLPLLLNIPSLKESIDIEKRNYKISNVTLSISNMPYEGKRFSELVGETSLINTECRIYWVSPNADLLLALDAGYELPSNPSDSHPAAFEMYYGVIRRYEHDDNKVKLIVEDRSQSKLHINLPTTDTGSAETLPERYRNKKIPIVYGHVDKSPLQANHSEATDEEQILELALIADTRDIDGFISTIEAIGDNITLPISTLYFFENDTYFNIAETNDDVGESGGDINFQIVGSNIILDTDTIAHGSSVDETAITNDTSKGRLRIFMKRDVWNVHEYDKWHDLATDTQGSYEDTTGSVEFETIADFGKITGTIEAYSNGFPTYLGHDKDYNVAAYKCSLEVLSEPSDSSLLETWLFADVTHYNYGDEDNTPGGEAQNPSYQTPFGSGIFKTAWGVWVGNDDNMNYYHYLIWSGTEDGSYYGGAGHAIDSSFNNITGTDPLRKFRAETPTGHSIFQTLSQYEFIKIGIPRHSVYQSPSNIIFNVNTQINKLFLVHRLFAQGIADKDYYANLTGRLSATPTVPQIINDIMENELGQDVQIAPTWQGGYGDNPWLYAFTVNEKINSKKLIEGLASTSPYIPRFSNMGTFKYDVIPIDGGTADTIDINKIHTVKEEDVIDFSFSRTKIEDVKTRILFNYNWDYAREKFLNSYSWSVEDAYGASELTKEYDRNYYGFPKNDDGDYEASDTYDPDADSTLEIDDDRGKYIRLNDDDGLGNSLTAIRFTKWMLYWHMNSHLLMKIKLPLKWLFVEIGDIVEFEDIIGGIKPYGLNYKINETETMNLLPGGRETYNKFLITSTSKTLEYVQIECIQLHNLSTQTYIHGCMDNNTITEHTNGTTTTGACNYNADAQINEGCIYPTECHSCDGEGGVSTTDCQCDVDDDGNCDDLDTCVGAYDECGVCEGNGKTQLCECGENVCPGDDCPVCGCTQPFAVNYNLEATAGDSSCIHCTTSIIDGGFFLPICPYSENSAGQDTIGENAGYIQGTGGECLQSDGTPCPDWVSIISQGTCPDAQEYYNECGGDGSLCNGEPLEIYSDIACTYGEYNKHVITEFKIYWKGGFSLEDWVFLGKSDGGYDPTNEYQTHFTAVNIFLQQHPELLAAIEQEEDIYFKYEVTFLNNTPSANGDNNLIIELAGNDPNSEDTNLYLFHPMFQKTNMQVDSNNLTITFNSEEDETTNDGYVETEGSAWGTGGWVANTQGAVGLTKFLNKEDWAGDRYELILPIELRQSSENISEIYFPIENYILNTGQPPIVVKFYSEGSCTQLGDVNGDGGWNILDVVMLLNCILALDVDPDNSCANDCGEANCWGCAGDMNDDGGYNVLDVVILVNCILAGNCGDLQ